MPKMYALPLVTGAPPPDFAGGADDAPPDPLVAWGGGYSLPISHPTRRFRRRFSHSGAFGARYSHLRRSKLGTFCGPQK